MTQLKASIYVDLAGNVSRRAQAYSQSIGQMASNSRRSLGAMNASVTRVSDGIDQFGNRAALAGAGIAWGFNRTFVATAATFERYQIMLNELTGSAENGARAMDWITEFVNETPYSVEQVTASFVKMKAFGLDPMDGSMQAIVDQTAKLGGGQQELEGIVLALGQAWTKQKLQGEEALQLIERGVPVWDLLSQATGLSAVKLQEMSSQGKLGRRAIRALLDEMGKQSSGAALRQMETWSGLTSNLGDQWTLLQKQVMDGGAFDALKVELKGVLATMTELRESGDLDEMAKTVSEELVIGLRAAKDAGQGLWQVLQQVGSGVGAVADMAGGYANLAKILAAVYLGNKALRVASWGVNKGMGAARAGRSAWRWARGRRGGAAGASAPGAVPEAQSLGQAIPVVVTNWPAGFSSQPGAAGGGRHGKGGRRGVNRGRRGRGGVRSPVPAVSGAANTRAMATGAGGARLAAKLSRFGGLPGAAVGLVTAGSVLASDASKEDKGGILGGMGGSALGAAIGTVIAPGIGTALGSVLGGMVGDWLGSRAGAALEKQEGEVTVKIETDPGMRARPVQAQGGGGLDVNVDTGMTYLRGRG